ncbi:MAG: GTPase HflX, partial [Kiritimatiellia bacterium]|nr:GTPase HflX [Kiritimatiellia bacterium]
MRDKDTQTSPLSDSPIDQAIVVGVQRSDMRDWQVEEAMDEMAQLAATAGVNVLDRHIFRLRKATAALLLGRGQAEEMAARVADCGANVVLFDEDLSPVQSRNLENVAEVRVLDRTQVILDI